MCWWKHTNHVHMNNPEQINCYICSDTYKTIEDLMKHRKKAHPNIIKRCNKFNDNKCVYRSDTCWFRHEKDEEVNKRVEEDEDMVSEEGNKCDSDFQQAPTKKKPPANNCQ